MRNGVRLAVIALVLAAAGLASAGQTPRSAPTKSAEDYLFVCRTDAPLTRCLEVTSSTDFRSSEPPSARIFYFEVNSQTAEARGLNCAIAPASLAVRSAGGKLREAIVEATIWPGTEACEGSFGEWAPDPVDIALEFSASADFLQQTKGHGVVQMDGATFRYVDALDSWSVVAAGAVHGTDFDGATGSIQTVRRTNISKTH